MNLKEFITESFNKEYGYRIKIAADCGADHMDRLEKILQKYDLVSASPWKRTPIQENPMEFVRAKGVKFVSEVCSTDIILKYPINEKILEVYLAANMGFDFDRVLTYAVKEPRRLESDNAAERTEYNKDRQEDMEEARLMDEDQAHYEMQNEELDEDLSLYGEEYNKKFLDMLAKVKAEKGENYFRNYPTKDEISGDNLRPLYDTITGTAHGGHSPEAKEVSVNDQNMGHP